MNQTFDIATEQSQVIRQGELAKELLSRDPRLTFISAFVIAGDTLGAERIRAAFVRGELPLIKALVLTGSYARFDFAVWVANNYAGHKPYVLSNLLNLWTGSDPDDGNPDFLQLWLEAFERNGSRYLRDGKALPAGKTLRVYRGQDPGPPSGISWSTDKRIAEKFANGAATRQARRGGVILERAIRRGDVLAFLTGRGESEVIVETPPSAGCLVYEKSVV